MKKFTYIKNVATLQLATDKCTGCKICLDVCPQQVFQIKNKKAVIKNLDNCMECGACVMNCPFSALSVKAGTGCANAIINGILTGKEPSCSCSGDSDCC